MYMYMYIHIQKVIGICKYCEVETGAAVRLLTGSFNDSYSAGYMYTTGNAWITVTG